MTVKDMQHARALKKCPDCGREVTGNNLSRHRATHTNGTAKKAATNGHKKPGPKAGSSRAATMAVGHYLDEVAEGSAAYSGQVSLGALVGFPTHTDDPDVVDAAADSIEQRAAEATTRIVEVKLRQRAANLRDAAAVLRDDAGASTEAEFIAVAAEWAEQNGITYSTFRDMGVPARVLKEAGIPR